MGGGKAASLVIGPKEGYAAIVDKGEQLCNASLIQIFALSTMAGCFIGFGALLSLTISGNIDGALKCLGPGVGTWLFAALFPVNLLFILLSGCILYTGATFTCPSAWIEGKANIMSVIAVISVAWIGNIVGGFGFALLTEACGLNEGGVARLVIKVLKKKTGENFGVIFLRGIGCNWLVCMAVFLQTLSNDMSGKYVGIFFPISTFVACGFEHYPANAYALPLAWLAGMKDEYKEDGLAGWDKILGLNLIPCSLGNLFAGVIIMSCGFSYFYGTLRTCPPPAIAAKMRGEQQEQSEIPRLAAVEEYMKQILAQQEMMRSQQRPAPGSPEDLAQRRDFPEGQNPAPAPAAPAAAVQPPYFQAAVQNNAGFARTVSC